MNLRQVFWFVGEAADPKRCGGRRGARPLTCVSVCRGKRLARTNGQRFCPRCTGPKGAMVPFGVRLLGGSGLKSELFSLLRLQQTRRARVTDFLRPEQNQDVRCDQRDETEREGEETDELKLEDETKKPVEGMGGGQKAQKQSGGGQLHEQCCPQATQQWRQRGRSTSTRC